jgi:hypothetical protein
VHDGIGPLEHALHGDGVRHLAGDGLDPADAKGL